MNIVSRNLDISALRTFETGVTLGTFARASSRLGRSPAAISAQLKKLEEQAGVALFQKSGRNLALTEHGETLLGYARQILSTNDAALAAMRTMQAKGKVCLGLQEDLGDGVLARVLARFAGMHPNIRIETRVCRNAELISGVNQGELDLAVIWGSGAGLGWSETLAELPMVWVGSANSPAVVVSQGRPAVKLVAFPGQCLFKAAAVEALSRAGIAWETSFTSSSLHGLFSAAGAGLGITVRTAIGLPAGVAIVGGTPAGSWRPSSQENHTALPRLPAVPLTMVASTAQREPPVDFLAETLREAVLGLSLG